MTKDTHSSGGFLFALIALNAFINGYIKGYAILYQILLVVIFFHFANLGSVFPDIDMKGSYISKRHPFLSKAFKKCKHRGVTHSFLFIAILYVISLALAVISHENIVVISICGGFILGYISHLVLDLLTKEGIELFFPFRTNIRFFNIKTGSKGEKTFHKFLKLIIALFLIYNVYLISIRYFHFDLIKFIMDKTKY